MQSVNVGLGERSYPIIIGAELDYGSLTRKTLPKVHQLMVVTNETVGPLYLSEVKKQLETAGFQVSTCVLKDGEAYKTVDSWLQILTALLENDFGRDGALLALGGGVVGDMTGFAASAYQRGIDYVQVPTTLLSMVDSSVGGKTAINHPLGKNMIGAFYQPKAVFADISSLKTLPQRELSAGLGEVIKYGIIEDGEFFSYLEREIDRVFALDDEVLSFIVRRCCEIKADVVSRDEQEHGVRALLNLGHTFGHALEAHLGFGTWLHGEGVGLGMVIAAALSEKRKLIDAAAYARIVSLIRRGRLPVAIPESMEPEDFIRHMRHDKKVRRGVIRYVLPTAIGSSEVFADIGDDEVLELLAALKD